MWLLWCYMVKDVFLLNESLFTLILGANVWNSFDWGINGWVIANKRWLDRIRMFGAEHVDLSKGLFFPHSENVSPFSFLHKKSTPTMRSWSPTPFWNFPLSSCVGFVFVWEKNQGKVAFTCLNPVGFLEWLNWAILGWVCSLKVSSLLSKDSRQYSYSHQKQGESQKPSFSSIVPHVLYIYIPFFSCERFSQSQNGGEETSIVMLEVFWDSWASAVWIWNWLCGKIVSLLKIWTYNIAPPDPVINRIITIHIWGSNNPSVRWMRSSGQPWLFRVSMGGFYANLHENPSKPTKCR